MTEYVPVVFIDEGEVGYDNRVELSLRIPQEEGGVALPTSLSLITSMSFSIPALGLIINSESPSSGPIIWDESVTLEVGKVILSFGGEPLTEGSFVGWMITYDPDHPNGLVWGGVSGIAFAVVVVPSTLLS